MKHGCHDQNCNCVSEKNQIADQKTAYNKGHLCIQITSLATSSLIKED